MNALKDYLLILAGVLAIFSASALGDWLASTPIIGWLFLIAMAVVPIWAIVLLGKMLK
jgi:hypothetical protein